MYLPIVRKHAFQIEMINSALRILKCMYVHMYVFITVCLYVLRGMYVHI
jgi:hypothetical protein